MQERILEQDFFIKSSRGQMPVFAVIPSAMKADVPPEPNALAINTAKTIILVHEIFGLNEHIKDVARRFASEGFSVFAPDLFFKAKDQGLDCNDLASMRVFWQSLSDEELMASLSGVYQLAYSFKLASSSAQGPGKIGVLGYCMGGAIASMFAGCDEKAAFLVTYYGRIKYPQLSSNKPRHPLEYVKNIRCPVLGIFSSQDDLISHGDVELFKSTLESENIPVTIKMYDAPHAFFNDTRDTYRPEAAQDAWNATLEFLNSI